ncbi:MAG TPA: four helix bundle protein [Thermoanaerobaculia bacterium]
MDYKDLLAWQRAMELCLQIYDATDEFPDHEVFRLAAQLRKTAYSVPSNIAEGEGRLTWGERRQFLSQARGSLFELETQLIIARHRKYTSDDTLFAKWAETRAILEGYIAYVRKRERGRIPTS